MNNHSYYCIEKVKVIWENSVPPLFVNCKEYWNMYCPAQPIYINLAFCLIPCHKNIGTEIGCTLTKLLIRLDIQITLVTKHIKCGLYPNFLHSIHYNLLQNSEFCSWPKFKNNISYGLKFIKWEKRKRILDFFQRLSKTDGSRFKYFMKEPSFICMFTNHFNCGQFIWKAIVCYVFRISP